MLQHNITRDTTLLNEVKLVIDTGEYLYRFSSDYRSTTTPLGKFSDVINITLPNGGIDRVSKIRVDKINIPFTKNINNNNLKFSLFEERIFYAPIKEYIIPTLPKYDGSGDVINFIDNIVTAYDTDPIYITGGSYMKIYTDIVPNKIVIQVINNDASRYNKKLNLAATNLTYSLGFTSTSEFKYIGFGYSTANRTDQFEINDSNNSFVITNDFEVLPDITITVPNATYNVYTLGFALAKLGIEYKYYAETGGVTINHFYRRFVLNPTPLTILMGFQSTTYTERTVISTKNYDETFINNRIAVDYTSLQINSNTYTIPVGNYTIQEIIVLLNAQNLYDNTVDPPYPEFQFSYSSSTNKVSIVNLRELNGDLIPDPTLYIYGSGLAQLLGLNYTTRAFIESDNASAVDGIYYTFPNNVALNPKYYTVNSNYLTQFRETNTIKYPQLNTYNDNILYNTLGLSSEIYLSRKIKLETFDLFLANNKGELVSLRDDNIIITLTLTIS